MQNDYIYHKLRQQIDKMPVGMPPSNSGVEIRILKHLFTPEEAKLALNLNIFLEPLDRIYSRVKRQGESITLQKLEQVLDHLVMKGSILSDEQNGEKRYSYALFVVGMYEFQVDRMTREFYEDCEEYNQGEFRDEFTRTGIPQLRVVPIEQSIPIMYHVATYDDIRNVINKTEGPFSLANCVCKQGKDLIERPCQVTDLRETCIGFPPLSTYYHKIGRGRLITKDHALKILQQAEDAGLVLQPFNAQQPLFVCCCCGDCCGILLGAKTYSHPAEHFATNYYAEVDSSACSGCGICVQRCQMNAPYRIDSTMSINLNHCIGCGLCVPTCPLKAITLQLKEQETVPPKTADDLYMKIMAKKIGTLGMMKIGIQKLLRQKI